ncbi:hypothetical protein [Andreprevotia chitinilytica]|uniref:hypothetical protein n=1 Tax=Andreprevotia chitinilytica TaxID=396808 RepID=UPI00054D1585|nr:hypothetical protein [Andreprevotia chitinilytica]
MDESQKLKNRKRGRIVLLALIALSAFPIIAAQAVFHWGQPEGGRSFGRMLAQPAAPASSRWRLVAVGHDCGAAWNDLLVASRQLRLAQGQDTERIERATSGACNDAALTAVPGNPHLAEPGLYLVDPRGNAVTHYAPDQLSSDANRRKVLQEIGKILKNNQGLG